ncbi:MAG TPA: hypothetical protein VGC32_18145 [Solirubrobacterales bacterium]
MSNATQHLEGPIGRRTRSCATELVCRDCGYRTPLLDQAFKCPACGEGLDIDYDYERAKETIAEFGMTERPWNVWRLRSCCRSRRRTRRRGSPSSRARRR